MSDNESIFESDEIIEDKIEPLTQDETVELNRKKNLTPSRRAEWMLREDEPCPKKRYELVSKFGTKTHFEFVEPEGTIEAARRIIEAFKSGNTSTMKKEVKSLVALGCSVHTDEEILEGFNREEYLWYEGFTRYNVPARYFPFRLRYTNLAILLMDPWETLKFHKFPGPKTYISPDIMALSIYAKLHHSAAKSVRRNAMNAGANMKM
jgi:hypothetical protein